MISMSPKRQAHAGGSPLPAAALSASPRATPQPEPGPAAPRPSAVTSSSDAGPSALAQQLCAAARAFVTEVCCWVALDGPEQRALSADEAQATASRLLSPSCAVHPDGLLGCEPPLAGVAALLVYVRRERAAYRTVGLEPLLMAAHDEQRTVFALSRLRVESTGPWHGQEATGRVSEGIRVDELRFDDEGRIAEAWCNRQLFEEERQALLRDPATHHAVRFDTSLLRQVSEQEDGAHGPLAAHKMMQVAGIWAESWNVATASGSLNPDLLDNLAEEDLRLCDLLGMAGDAGQDHPWDAVHSREEAKRVLVQVSDKYDVDETVVRTAAAKGWNVTFSHWRARMTPRTPQSIAARAAAAAEMVVSSPGPAAPPAVAQGGSSGVAAQAAEGGGGLGAEAGGGGVGAGVAASVGAGEAAAHGVDDDTTRPQALGGAAGAGNAAAGGAAGAGGDLSSAHPPFVAEATDLLLFAPSGRLQAIYQFRRPLGSDRRRVLVGGGGGGGGVAPPPAGDADVPRV